MMGKPLIPNDDQMTLMASQVGDIYTKMAQDLMLSMIKRIKQRGTADLEREPYLWQLEKLNQMHMLNQSNIDVVIQQTGIAKELILKIIQNEGLKVYQNTSEQLAEQLGVNPPHNDVNMALASYVQQVFRDYDNYINQTLLSTNFGDNEALKVYQGIIQETVAKVVSGVSTADQAVNDTVMQWLGKGIPSSFIDKGGNRWSIDAYARMVMDSTTARVYNDMRTRASEELGVDTYYYSIHAASRPACAPIQARIVTKGSGFYSEELGDRVEALSDHGWGQAGGCLGIHCHHYLTPFVIGVNVLPDLPDELKHLTPEQAIANGEKQARQRAYERAIRMDRYKLEASKRLGDDRRIQHYSQLLKNHSRGLNDLLKENSFLVKDTVSLSKAKNSIIESYRKDFANQLKKQYNEVKRIPYSQLTAEQKKVVDINEQKNNRHIRGTHEFNEYTKNYQAKLQKRGIDNDSIQSILHVNYEQSQKIVQQLGLLEGYPKVRSIIVDFNKAIGTFVDEKTGKRVPTKKVRVTYSKNGTHLTPIEPTGKGRAYIEI